MAESRGTRTDALVLRTIPYGETSQVVHLATAERGLVAALAKGSLRPGPEFQGGVPLGVVGVASLVPRRGELEALRSFAVKDGFRGLGASLPRYYAACYVLELARAWLRPALPVPALYRAAVTALRSLASAPDDAVPGWVVWFEARALAAAGHRPRLETCSGCGAEIASGVFSPAAGGIAHPRCAAAGPAIRVAPGGLSGLRRLYAARIADLAREPLSRAEVRVARTVHDALVPWVLEDRPSALATLPRP